MPSYPTLIGENLLSAEDAPTITILKAIETIICSNVFAPKSPVTKSVTNTCAPANIGFIAKEASAPIPVTDKAPSIAPNTASTATTLQSMLSHPFSIPCDTTLTEPPIIAPTAIPIPNKTENAK